MDLYVWNSQIAAAFFESLHYVEVGLRNAIDRELQAAFAEGDNPWFSMPILTRESVKRVKDAQRRAGGASPRRDKVIAELSLGFWWSLFAADYSGPCGNQRFSMPSRARCAANDYTRNSTTYAYSATGSLIMNQSSDVT